MGQTLSEPITQKHSDSGSDERYAYGVSEMQGWRLSMFFVAFLLVTAFFKAVHSAALQRRGQRLRHVAKAGEKTFADPGLTQFSLSYSYGRCPFNDT